ncbi:MAG TPA: mechanosensitive ion channel domain-containing protein [Methylibium sp.]|nr:mechanosensitive ion channel domain-containing protein [Methylibium sp.]
MAGGVTVAAARPLNAEELAALGRALWTASAGIELAVVAACLGLAWLLARLLRGGRAADAGSVLFGEKLYDGALLPVLALGLALLARHTLLADFPRAVFPIAIAMLLSLALIRIGVRVLRAAFPRSQLVRIAERWLSWAVWIGLILWLTGVLPVLLEELDAIRWKLGATTVTLRALLEGAFNAVVVLVAVLWLTSAIETRLLKGQVENLSLRKIAANATRALLLFVGLLVALSAAGIDLTALSVLGGAVGVGIGFGLQKLAANYVSGFVILAERSLRIGDLVKVDGFEGRITDINTRATIIRAANGRESIVPNELLITQRVENASLAEPALMSSTVVQVAYGTDLERLRPLLLARLLEIPRVMKDADHRPSVHLSAFAADGLELTVWYWNADPENGQSNLRSEVNLAVLAVLEAEGIEIPYPQRVLRWAAGAATPPVA